MISEFWVLMFNYFTIVVFDVTICWHMLFTHWHPCTLTIGRWYKKIHCHYATHSITSPFLSLSLSLSLTNAILYYLSQPWKCTCKCPWPSHWLLSFFYLRLLTNHLDLLTNQPIFLLPTFHWGVEWRNWTEIQHLESIYNKKPRYKTFYTKWIDICCEKAVDDSAIKN